MAAKFEKLKEELESLEKGEMLSKSVTRKNSHSSLFQTGLSSPGWVKKLLLVGFLGSFLFYAGTTYFDTSPSVDSPLNEVPSWESESPKPMLNNMRTQLQKLGYTNLTEDQLVELQEQEVTATFLSRMSDLGYNELSLDEAVKLRENGVSSTFAAMMKELGYDLSVEELISLRQHEVTAYFTSNFHDLGYSKISIEELIQLKDAGVKPSEVEQSLTQNGQRPTIEELIDSNVNGQ